MYIAILLTLLNVNNVWTQELERSKKTTRVLYVATNGNNQWTGTLPTPDTSGSNGPLATLQGARNAIRKLRQNGSKDAFTVLVRGGIYELNETFVLGPEDSGTESDPLVFRAFNNERPILSGTRQINNFQPYKGKIHKANLMGIINVSYPVRQLFANGKRQILARYPNFDPLNPIGGGFLYIDSPAKEGSKREFRSQDGSIRDWTNIQDAEVVIYPGDGWNNNIRTVFDIGKNTRAVSLSQDTDYEIKSGNRYFFQNLIEELDSPGEWFFDRQNKALYYWPVDEAVPRSISVPVIKSIIEIKEKKYYNKYKSAPAHIRFEGFTLEGCQGSAIVISGANKTVIAKNTIYNAGNHGIEIQGGSENSAVGNDVYEVGGQGIYISSGDRKTLTSGENRVENNYIHHVGVFHKASSGIFCRGVGNIVSHNLIHSTPRTGIYLDGNDHLIEYNHIHHVNQETRDSGIIYCSGVDWTKRGNVIQFNHFHDSGGYGRNKANEAWQVSFDTFGIYIDDWLSGTKVYGNIVANTASGGILIHSGRDNIVENNIIIEGGRFGQMVYSAWPPSHPTAQKLLPVMFAKIKEMEYKKYPQLSTITNIATGAKMSGNSFVRNIVYYNGQNAILYGIYNDIDLVTTKSDYNVIYHADLPLLVPYMKVLTDLQWKKWKDSGLDKNSLVADPLFTGIAKGDFTLAPASPALKMGFKPIPFEKIGPYKDSLRASWPLPIFEAMSLGASR
jgi:parallel beta-helix repeat protein